MFVPRFPFRWCQEYVIPYSYLASTIRSPIARASYVHVEFCDFSFT